MFWNRKIFIGIVSNSVLEYALRRVQVKEKGLKLNDTHQFLVHADDINILSWSVHTIKKNKEALLVVSKEIGLEVNAEKPKYMIMSREQKTKQNHNIKSDTEFFERVEHFKYLETNLTNQNSIQEDIKSRLESSNDCHHGVQNLLSSSLLSKK